MHKISQLATRLPSSAQIYIYLAGCLVFSFGAYLFIHAGLGTDPLDVFSIGLKNHLFITIGLGQAAVAVICLAIVALLRGSVPVISPFLTFFLCGSLIDILLAIDVLRDWALRPELVMFSGSLACAYGSSLIIMSGFGIRPIDLLAIEMTSRWGLPFWSTKGIIEATLLLSGWLLGGPVGVGTLTFLLIVNGLIQPMMWLNNRFLRISNVGLPSMSVNS